VNDFNPRDYLNPACDIARAAGRRILDVYERGFSVEQKEDRSPLTEADRAAHELICEKLEQLTPGVPVLSEESAKVDYEKRAEWKRFWLVDPLDGTKEFINRNGEFTVNIALIEAGVPVLGVVYAPVLGVVYAGTADEGAFREEADGRRTPIRVTTPHQRPVRVVGSRSHAGDSLGAYLARLEEQLGSHQMVSMGSSLKLCLVAEGKADLYPRLGPTSEWDTAAAQAVVEAAGGQVTDLQLRPLRYNSKDSLLNPHFLVFGDPGVDWAGFLAQD
jgi:3'(2'), 5'-bisphosphate nucleotidase